MVHVQKWNSVPDKIERKRQQRTRSGEGRSDKKKKVSPWVSNRTAGRVHDVARYLTAQAKRKNKRAKGCSDGAAAHRVIVAAFFEGQVLSQLAPHFWRDYVRDNTLYPGHKKRPPLDELLDGHETRAHIRFTEDEWKAIDELAFAAGTDIAPMAAALLILGVSSDQVMAEAAPGFRPRSFYSLKEGTVEWH